MSFILRLAQHTACYFFRGILCALALLFALACLASAPAVAFADEGSEGSAGSAGSEGSAGSALNEEGALNEESALNEEGELNESDEALSADESGNVVDPQQLPDSSFIYDSSIEDLYGADSYYDDQTVQVTGEVIGDAINANLTGSMVWITLVDDGDANATVSVLMSAEAASRIDTFGRYGTTGTTLQVRGTSHLACRDHEGLSDLHAEEVSVVERGSVHADTFNINDFIPGAVFVGAGLLLLFIFYRLREGQR